MDHSTTFARHFARLVHLLLHEPKSIANQKAALRLLVAMAKEGQVTLAIRDWQVIANGALLPAQLEGVEDLGAQLIGHAVSELVAEKDASAADLLAIARTLATEPVPGDGGQGVAEKLAALGAKTVRVTLSGNAPLPRVATVSMPTHGSEVPAPVPPPPPPPATNGVSRNTADVAVVAKVEPAPMAPAPQRRPSTELSVMRGITDSYLSQFAAPDTSRGSITVAFAQLDATTSVNETTKLVDAVAGAAEAAFREGDSETLAVALAGLVKREAAAGDPNLRRAYGMGVRRLAKKPMLAVVAPLLASQREMYEELFAIFARTGDDGAEALIEQLSAAQSLAERRVYFDSLRKVNAGVQVLIHMLGDSRWYVVRNAADLLGEMSANDAEGKLSELLQHDDDRVRKAAVSALSKMTGAGAVKGLSASLEDGAPGVRMRAAAALGASKTPAAANALIKHIEREDVVEVQHACLSSLGKIATGDAIRFLTKAAQPATGLFKKKATAFRVAAVRALGEARTPAAMGALQNLLHDKEKDVREAVFWAVRAGKGEKNAE
ncbi:MAG TPA: HEAT repeat domain-containing protein [Gemmatimonadaceae bacterium]|nr:HEAT repeat domain-containing protein [Gemmatimonadaceae bacterium]